MPRKVTCRLCRVKEEKGLMMKVKTFYYHDNCYKHIEEEERAKKREFDDWCELYELIKKIHKLPDLIQRFTSNLQDIRNGTIRMGKYTQRRSKEGISYKEMTLAYERCRDNIERVINTMQFESPYHMLQYTLAIAKQEMVKMTTEKIRNETTKVEEQQIVDKTESLMRIKENLDKRDKTPKPQEEKIDLTRLLEDD